MSGDHELESQKPVEPTFAEKFKAQFGKPNDGVEGNVGDEGERHRRRIQNIKNLTQPRRGRR